MQGKTFSQRCVYVDCCGQFHTQASIKAPAYFSEGEEQRTKLYPYIFVEDLRHQCKEKATIVN